MTTIYKQSKRIHPETITDGEYLEVRWNELKDYDIHFKRFKRMGALLEWVELNPNKVVSLAIYNKLKQPDGKPGEQ